MGTGPPIRRAPKPTRVAHLSDYMPTRIYWNFPTVTAWLYDQQFQCVLDAIEQQVISGDGSVENMTGILATSGTTDIAFNTDLPTTLRSAVSALQNLGETPTAWALNPTDAQAIDLLRWGTGGGGGRAAVFSPVVTSMTPASVSARPATFSAAITLPVSSLRTFRRGRRCWPTSISSNWCSRRICGWISTAIPGSTKTRSGLGLRVSSESAFCARRRSRWSRCREHSRPRRGNVCPGDRGGATARLTESRLMELVSDGTLRSRRVGGWLLEVQPALIPGVTTSTTPAKAKRATGTPRKRAIARK